MLVPESSSLVTCHCRTVKPPAGATVDPLLAGPWSSTHLIGPEAVVVPSAGLAAGVYTVVLTATYPNTSFSLEVRHGVMHLHTLLHHAVRSPLLLRTAVLPES